MDWIWLNARASLLLLKVNHSSLHLVPHTCTLFPILLTAWTSLYQTTWRYSTNVQRTHTSLRQLQSNSTSPVPLQASQQGFLSLTRISRFSPYSDNGGTILAIAGADFAVIAGDTRQSEGYSIQTRYARKVFQL
jgi:hypothetical protein